MQGATSRSESQPLTVDGADNHLLDALRGEVGGEFLQRLFVEAAAGLVGPSARMQAAGWCAHCSFHYGNGL
jgi:hypothetical protein